MSTIKVKKATTLRKKNSYSGCKFRKKSAMQNYYVHRRLGSKATIHQGSASYGIILSKENREIDNAILTLNDIHFG